MQNLLSLYGEIPPYVTMTGYEAKTTYWGDFRVCLGDTSAIRDTYKRAQRLAKQDSTYGAELALALNWLMWYYHDHSQLQLSRLYQELWEDWDAWVMDNYKGEDLQYYLRVTD